ncbi:hypothetical protein ACM66B_001860 [Microbotryomycetes sp. NB124-2]
MAAESPPGQGADTPLTPVELFEQVSKYACLRPSPRPCVNQALVDALNPLREERFVLFGTQSHEGVSYARALSAIIGCPYKIETMEQAMALPYIGDKLGPKIQQFIDTGRILEAEEAATNPMIQSRAALMTVHNVGFKRAEDLYNAGYRSPHDLRDLPEFENILRYHDDLQLKIPREEVESVANFIRIQLDRVEPGAYTVLTGGYRRGKTRSNDIDLLITYPHQTGKEKFVLRRLVHRLKEKGFIPEGGLLHFQESASKREGPDHKSAAQLDSLDHAFIVFKHPKNGMTRERDYYRRIDLIAGKWDNFGAAIVGWTGGTQFQRDLRRFAEKKDGRYVRE